MWKSVGGQYTSCKVPGGRNKTAAAAARRTRRDMVCYQDQDTFTRSRSRTLVRSRTVVLKCWRAASTTSRVCATRKQSHCTCCASDGREGVGGCLLVDVPVA